MRDLTDHDQALAKRGQDLADWQQEASGANGGKAQRFLSPNARDDLDPKARKDKEARQSALQRMLLNAVYRAAYEDFGRRLSQAEAQIDAALDKAADQIGTARAALDSLQNTAARLPDGTRVYRDAHGRIWTEDGTEIDDEYGVIVWPDNAPSYEDYLLAQSQLDAASAEFNRLQRIRIDVLGRIRDRYEDEDRPITQGEMDDFMDEIEAEMAAASNPRQFAAQEIDVSVAQSLKHGVPTVSF